jgi:hypothetical protein
MTGEVTFLAEQMRDYALRRKAALPREQQAIIDAIVYAETVHLNRMPPKELTAKLRGSAQAYRPCAPVLCAHMEAIADRLDKPTI